MLTIKTKIIFASTVVFGVMLVLFAFVIEQRTSEVELSKLDARLESQVDKIATELEENIHAGVFPSVTKLREIMAGGLPGARMQVIGREGKILVADSLLSVSSSQVWQEVMNLGSLRKQTFDILQHAYRCLWLRSEAEARIPYVVQLAAPMDEIHAHQRDLLLLFVVAIPLALVVTAAAASVITRLAFHPITGMIQTAKQITGSNLHQRLDLPHTHDEVHALGETLNNMMERIDGAFKSQQQFVADASHEIRTPLTVICSELEFAEQRVSDPTVKESIQTSLSETDRLARLADGLLLLAKLDAAQLKLSIQPFRFDELLAECMQLVGSVAAKKQINLRVNIEEAVEVAADREKLKSVVLNLLDNAIKYSAEQTTVSVSLARKLEDAKKIVISVEDQGVGIPASVLPYIFKRFYRVDPSRSDAEGHGLGLAIVERLLQLHGGSISVKSEVGKGSIFIVELPSEIRS